MNQHQLNKEIESFIKRKMLLKQVIRMLIKLHFKVRSSGAKGAKGATGEGVLYEFFTPGPFVAMWDLLPIMDSMNKAIYLNLLAERADC